MTIEFKGSNAVVVAPPNPNLQFNPAIFSQIWMMQHLQLNQDDFLEGAVLMPILFQQPTRRFNLLVVQERIQLSLTEQQAGDGDLVMRTILEVLGQFSPNICHAAGLNFNWIVSWDGRRNSETSRRLFFAERNPLFRSFDVADACFGAYASKDYLGTRLKVDAKPVTGTGNEINTTGVFFNFNFHKDLAQDNQIEQVRDLLGCWEQASNEASLIMGTINAEFSS